MDQAPRTRPARTPLMIVASVLVLLGVGIAHDRGYLNLAVSLIAYGAVLVIVLLAGRPGAE